MIAILLNQKMLKQVEINTKNEINVIIILIIIFHFQILIANKGDKWKNKFNESFQNELYILKPTTLSIQVEKCLITDDPRLPLLKVTGELPAIDIKIAGEY